MERLKRLEVLEVASTSSDEDSSLGDDKEVVETSNTACSDANVETFDRPNEVTDSSTEDSDDDDDGDRSGGDYEDDDGDVSIDTLPTDDLNLAPLPFTTVTL